VAAAALALEQALAVGHDHGARVGVALRGRDVPPSEERRHARGEELRVVDRGVALPLAVGLVAEQELRGVVAVGSLVALAQHAELFPEQADVVGLAGEKQPVGAELGGVDLEHRRRVALRIHADRIEHHVAAGALAEELVCAHQARGLERTHFGALGIHEVDRDRFALDEVVVEPDRLSILRGQRDVGEIVRAPPAVPSHGAARRLVGFMGCAAVGVRGSGCRQHCSDRGDSHPALRIH